MHIDENTIVAYVDGRLSNDRAAIVRGHADVCTSCRRLIAAIAAGAHPEGEADDGKEEDRNTVVDVAPRVRDALVEGERVAGYLIEQVVGAGGMGVVYRARSTRGGAPVALKILPRVREDGRRRLLREGHVLQRLDDPAIVRYLAHGLNHDRAPYVVMEWIDGVTLATRLRDGPLTLEETMSLGLQLAGALAAVHRSGIIHRDVKPSNVMLVGGRPSSPKLVDFGIARVPMVSVRTAPGTLIGTPTYMSPEQALGRPVDASSDVFSLGCVLYACLAGQPPFAGGPVSEVIARISSADPPPLRASCPGVPSSIEELVARMLSKDPRQRPADGVELAQRLDAIRRELEISPSPETIEQPGLSTTIAAHPVARALLHRVRTLLAPFDADVERLVDGTVIAVLRAGGGADDRAARGARCARVLVQYLGDAKIALVTGHSAHRRTSSVAGDAVERARALVVDAGGSAGEIVLDATTAELLDRRFHIERSSSPARLLHERSPDEGARTVLGRSTVLVGRDAELTSLGSIFDECRVEHSAVAVLLTGEAGTGKSRLAAALVEASRRQDASVEVLFAAGDPTRADSPFALLADALRRAARVGTAGGAALQPLLDRLGDIASGRRESAPRGADLLALGDNIRRGFIDFLESECARRPVLLILEDLQWGDRPSVETVETALHALADRPLMVLACTRPEVHERFPHLFGRKKIRDVKLRPLSKRASHALVRALLGDELGDDVVERLIDSACGNVFFLEEMARAFGEHGTAVVPEGMMAMIETRLRALPSDARAVLQAASVYGERFGAAALGALVDPMEEAAVVRALETLLDAEILRETSDDYSSHRDHFAFRHAPLRDAAYGLSSPEERAALHVRAGQWLERAGENDAVKLASHFDRGGERASASRFYLRAARQALAGNDFIASIDRAERAIVSGGEDGESFEARLVIVEARRARAQWDQASAMAMTVLSAARLGSAEWFLAAGEHAYACVVLGRFDVALDVATAIVRAWDTFGPSWPSFQALTKAAISLFYAGRLYAAHEAHAKVRQASFPEAGDHALAMKAMVDAMACLVDDDHEGHLSACVRAALAFERVGDERAATGEWIGAADVCQKLGLLDRGESILRAVLATAERIGLPGRVMLATACLGELALRRGALEEARGLYERCLEVRGHENLRLVLLTNTHLAEIHFLQGRLDDAARSASAACEGEGDFPHLRSRAEATLARIRLARGEEAEALVLVRRAIERLESAAQFDAEEGEVHVQLAAAEIEWAVGDRERARAIVVAARTRLQQRASRLRDPKLRAAFLEQPPEHAMLLARAQEWC